jgi:putative transposase
MKAIAENKNENRKEWMLWMFGRAGSKNPNNKNFQFWQQDNHPIELFNNALIQQKLEYIHNNPVRAGLVFFPEEYVYSSARNYASKKDYLFEVKIIE